MKRVTRAIGLTAAALLIGVGYGNCGEAFKPSQGVVVGASTSGKPDCESKKLDVFARKYYPMFRTKCIACHDGSFAPNNRPDRLFASADLATGFTAFTYSDDRYLLVARNAQLESHAGAGHTGPENSATIQSAQSELETVLASPECVGSAGAQTPTIVLNMQAASLAAVQSSAGLKLMWSLDSASDVLSKSKITADLTGVKIQVTLTSHAGSPAYLVSAPRLQTGASDFKIKGIFLTINSVVKDESTTFSLLNADVPASITFSSSASLLSEATMVINSAPVDQDLIGLKLIFDAN